jgi:hypothetical protein
MSTMRRGAVTQTACRSAPGAPMTVEQAATFLSLPLRRTLERNAGPAPDDRTVALTNGIAGGLRRLAPNELALRSALARVHAYRADVEFSAKLVASTPLIATTLIGRGSRAARPRLARHVGAGFGAARHRLTPRSAWPFPASSPEAPLTAWDAHRAVPGGEVLGAAGHVLAALAPDASASEAPPHTPLTATTLIGLGSRAARLHALSMQPSPAILPGEEARGVPRSGRSPAAARPMPPRVGGTQPAHACRKGTGSLVPAAGAFGARSRKEPEKVGGAPAGAGAEPGPTQIEMVEAIKGSLPDGPLADRAGMAGSAGSVGNASPSTRNEHESLATVQSANAGYGRIKRRGGALASTSSCFFRGEGTPPANQQSSRGSHSESRSDAMNHGPRSPRARRGRHGQDVKVRA